MSSKATPPASPGPPPIDFASGKFVIIGILILALAAAGGSWLFRYSATHKAARFWGPAAAGIIRDAASVDFLVLTPSEAGSPSSNEIESRGEKYRLVAQVDVSAAHGLVHLRNALLEDHNFDSFDLDKGAASQPWRWALEFHTGKDSTTVVFSNDCATTALATGGAIASCRPIAAGLAELFGEFTADRPHIRPPAALPATR